MRRILVLWLLLLLAACGRPTEPVPHIVTPTPVFRVTPMLAHPPTAPPPNYTPPTPAPTSNAYPPPTSTPPFPTPLTSLPPTNTRLPTRPAPTPFTPTAYPLPPTPTLAPPASPGRLLFSFPWPDTGPMAGTPGIVVGRDGTVFLTDVVRPGIHRYTADGQLLTPWPASSGSAQALAVGPDNTVYTIDSARSQVSRFTADGAPLGAWNGSRPDQPFRAAQAVAVGLDGTVYVADWAASSIYLFTSDGSPVGDWVGAPNGTGELYTPVALTIAPDGSLFVLEGRRRRVSRFDPAGRLIEWWDGPADGGRSFSPYALAVSADRVYVVDVANQRVQVYGYTPLVPPVPTLAATPPPPSR